MQRLSTQGVLVAWTAFGLAQLSTGSSTVPANDDVARSVARIVALEQRQQLLEQAIGQLQMHLQLPVSPSVMVNDIVVAAQTVAPASPASVSQGTASAPARSVATTSGGGGGGGAGAGSAAAPAAGRNTPSRVMAPFQVVDSRGQVIFEVGAPGQGSIGNYNDALIYNSAGKPVVDMLATADGGVIHASSGSNWEKSYVVMSGTSDFFGVSITQNGGPRARLQSSDADGASLAVYGGDKTKPVAQLGQGKGGGDLQIYDGGGSSVAELAAQDSGAELKLAKSSDATTYVATAASSKGVGVAVRKAGTQSAFMGAADNGGIVRIFSNGHATPVATMTASERGSGLVGVYNHSGTLVSFLTESTNAGGGNVTTADPNGNGVFSAGYDGGSDGAACVDRKQHLHCLGIGLPMSGN